MKDFQASSLVKLLLLFIAIIILAYINFVVCRKDNLAEKVVRSKTPVGAIGDSTQTKWEEEDETAH